MERAIVGFHQDDRGHWVAELACGHQRHVRHDPPFRLAPWVVEEQGRQERLGTPIDCGLCAREAGGEAACYAHLVCPDCGAVLDGGPHRPGCASAG